MSTQVFDSLGNPHLITSYFEKVAAADNTWNWYWSAENADGDTIGGPAAAVGGQSGAYADPDCL